MTQQQTAPYVSATDVGHTATPTTMRAIVQDKYGRPDEVLRLEDLAVPVPKDDEVLVRVHAASIHVGDLVTIGGEPIVARMATGLRKPKNRVPGTDISGTVVAVGDAVRRLRTGDQVFGWCAGAFAEYACAAEGHFVLKPGNLSFEQAAAVGVSASAALQLLRGRVGPGQRVLVNGASGGLGSFAVQIARALGAEVTGVCSTGNLDTVRSLGAAHVIDYTHDDFTRGEQRYDYILDNIANHSLSRTRRALTVHGVLQSNNGTSGGRWFGTMRTVIATAILSKFTRRQAGPSIKFPNREDLVALIDLVAAGKVRPLIGRTYPLTRAPEAIRLVAGGHAVGTVVLIADQGDVPPAA
jgi:NADPH:quinone reductase-like Zn-dependent oxidoreductase